MVRQCQGLPSVVDSGVKLQQEWTRQSRPPGLALVAKLRCLFGNERVRAHSARFRTALCLLMASGDQVTRGRSNLSSVAGKSPLTFLHTSILSILVGFRPKTIRLRRIKGPELELKRIFCVCHCL